VRCPDANACHDGRPDHEYHVAGDRNRSSARRASLRRSQRDDAGSTTEFRRRL